MRKFNEYIKPLLQFILIIILFVFINLFIRSHQPDIAGFIGQSGGFGFFIFILLTIATVVFLIPIDIVFLIPLAAALWGVPATAVGSIIGWTIGSGISFFIARRFGVSIVKKFLSLDKLYALQNRIPKTNQFWSVVLLRMVVPVDMLSYALGLFTSMKWNEYLLATFLGVIPFAFVFPYISSLPFHIELIAFTVIIMFVIVMLWIINGKIPQK